MDNSIKPKILYLVTKSNWGGAQKYVFELANFAKEQNYDVVVGLGGEGALKDELEKNHIKTIPINSLKRDVSIFKEFLVLFKILDILKKEKPDTVHLNSSKIGGIGSLACRLVGVKNIIYTAHGWAFNEELNIISKIFRIISSWLTILFCTSVIVLSEKEKKQVVSWPFSFKNKIKVISLGIKSFESIDKDESRNSFTKIDKNTTWVGTIAELHKNKGLDIAIDAFSKIKNHAANFIIIGEGEERENLNLQIKSLNLEDKVFLIGKVDNAASFIKAFDIFLISSRKEGLPFVLLEAGLAEVPVITTNVGGIPEIIKNKYNGILIEPKDYNEIVSAVDFLIGNPAEAKKYTENLKKDIQEKFSFDKMVSNTIALYLNSDTIN